MKRLVLIDSRSSPPMQGRRNLKLFHLNPIKKFPASEGSNDTARPTWIEKLETSSHRFGEAMLWLGGLVCSGLEFQ